MGRPRTFDRGEVLDRAVEIFWSRGYERTSVQNLVDSMGIQRGSLYATFGDKRRLFLAALDRYEERFYRDTRARIAGKQADEAIRLVFERVIEECACGDAEKGCFMTNTAVALAEDDEVTASRVRENLGRLEDVFFELLSRTRREEAKARALARFLTNTLQGLRVLSKCRVAPEVLQDVVDVTMTAVSTSLPTIPAPEKELSVQERRTLDG